MIQLLEKLCTLDGTSGDERTVRDFIISEIKDSCEYSVDNLGNVIAFKKGKNTPLKKVMLDAHTDEVGLIITCITDDGFLRFSAVGGINTSAMMLRRVLINGSVQGVIGSKPVHLAKGEEGKKLPDVNSLYIDIGAASREEAEQRVSVGDRAVICGEFIKCGDKILAKALDDRIGCAILIKLLKQDAEWDFYATFTTQEEVGLRGARAAAYSSSTVFTSSKCSWSQDSSSRSFVVAPIWLRMVSTVMSTSSSVVNILKIGSEKKNSAMERTTAIRRPQ